MSPTLRTHIGWISLSYAYAFNLARLGRFGDHLMEAAIFLAHGRLAMQIDTDRCTDPNAAMDIAAGYEAQALVRGLDSAIQTPRGDIGRTFVLNPPQASTLFVDDTTWRAARRQRLDKMAQSLLPKL